MSRRYAGHWARLAQLLRLPTSSHCTQLGSVSLQAREHGQRYTVKTETLAMKSANQTSLRDLGGRGRVRLNRPSCQGPADRRNSMRSRLPSWSSSLSIGSSSSHERLLLSSTFLQRSMKNAISSRLSPNGNPSFAKHYLSHKIPNNRACHPPRPSLRPIHAFTCVQAYDPAKRACSTVHHL